MVKKSQAAIKIKTKAKSSARPAVKLESRKNKAKSVGVQASQTPELGSTSLQDFWQKEIAQLANTKFSSYQTAVGSVLASVCEKLQVPEAKRPQTIERLSVLFETSDLLKQSLMKNLKIKE